MLTTAHIDIPSFVSSLRNHPNPYKSLLPLLEHSSNTEDPIPLLASSVLSSLLSQAISASTKSPPRIDEALPKLYKYLSTLLANNDSGLQDIAVQQFAALLRSERARELFWDQRQDIVPQLISILRAAAGTTGAKDNTSISGSTTYGTGSSRASISDIGLSGGVSVQLLYHVLLVFWQLSFYGSTVGEGLDE